ncbi:MAG TPA: hypothetical protein VGL77_01620 [Armatimonadota bacterium]
MTPRLRLAYIEDTACWDDEIVRTAGRIAALYRSDDGRYPSRFLGRESLVPRGDGQDGESDVRSCVPPPGHTHAAHWHA